LNLIDTAYLLPREVWIEKKSNIVIQAAPALKLAGIRPRLYGNSNFFDLAGTAENPTDPERPAGWKRWPIKGTSQTTVGAAGNTSNQYSTSGFQQNGFIVVYKSTNIVIDGLMLDGKRPTTFVNKNIWSDKYDVFFGNVGINLFQSKNVEVRNTEIANFFSAFYFQNRNVGGAFAMPNPNDIDISKIVPYSQFGKVGRHLIEKNLVRNNWYGIYDEMEWDLGSTIRYNIFNNNFNTQFAQNTDSSSDANNMTGGLMYEKDNSIVPHKVYNNTINGSSVVFGLSYFKSGANHYFYNNLLTGWNRSGKNAAMIDNDRQMLKRWKHFIYNNTFEIMTDSAFQKQTMSQAQIVDATAKDPNDTTKNCAAGCWINWDTPVTIYTGLQMNTALWSGWGTAQGGTYTGMYKGKAYTVTNAQVTDIFGVNAAGPITTMQGLGTTQYNVAAQKNYWSRKIPYLSTTPGSANFFEPNWASALVDTTILDEGWDAAGTRDADGSIPDRGAVPRFKGNVVSALNLVDQTIVQLDPTAKTVKFTYCLEGASGSWSNLKFSTNVYFSQVAAAFTYPDGSSDAFSKRDWSVPVSLTPTSVAPTINSCGTYTATLPVAPVDSLARFDLIVEGTLDGRTVRSNPGVWVWRKALYRLDAWFTNQSGATVTYARAGDTLSMHVIGRRTDNNQSIALDLLVASPDAPVYQVGKGLIVSGDTLGRNIPATGAVYPVYIEKTGSIPITLSGMTGTLPVPGTAEITIRPGLPERVLWETPSSYSLLDHSLPESDNATTFPQAPSAIRLSVVDKYGNRVDTNATVSLYTEQRTPPLPLASIQFSTAASGPYVAAPQATPATFAITPSNNGVLDFTVFSTGAENTVYRGYATVVGKTVVDTALFKIGKPLEKLYWTPVTAIDTFITVRTKLHLILSEDGTTVKATSGFAGATIRLRSSLGTSFYASATATTPTDSVVLVNGAADIWVTSLTPVKNDTLIASNYLLGQGLPEIYTPVSFRMPPLPPAPVPSEAGFVDVNCDGFADSIDVQLKDPTGVDNRLSTKVKIDSIHVVYGAVDRWLKTGWRVLSTDSSKVRIAVPTVPATRGSLTGSLSFAYTVARPPVPDTSYATAVVVIGDKVQPALMDTAYLVENFNRPTQDDTLKVRFTEVVNFPGSGWSFAAVNASNAVVASGTLTVKSAVQNPTDPTRWTVVFTGNTAGSLLAQGFKIRLEPTSAVSDANGNGPAGAECSPGVPVVEVASPVPVRKVWLKDSNGDGRADRLYVQLAKPTSRSIKQSDLPSLVHLAWGSAADSANAVGTSFLVGNDSTIWEVAVGPLAFGSTVGFDATGRGLASFSGSGRSGEFYAVEDSVSPIPVKASLTYAAGADILTVTFSEALKSVAVTGDWLEWKTGNGGDNALSPSAIPSSTDNLTWTFPLLPGSALNPNPGDSVRLPLTLSRLVALANGTQPSTTALSPYVLVVGGDRPPSSAWYTDENADGIVDAAHLVFTVPLKTSPTFKFRLGSEEKSIDSTNGLVIAPNRLSATVSFAASPFGSILTVVSLNDSLGTMTSKMGQDPGLVSKFPIADSIDPVILTAKLRYSDDPGAPGAQDTLRLTLSEPVNLIGAKEAVVWGLHPASQKNLNHTPGVVQVSATEVLVFFAPEGNLDHPGAGDSVRIAPIDLGGEMLDASGNGPSAALGKWTPVQVGQRPPQFAVAIYPSPLLVLKTETPDPLGLGTGPQVTVWIRAANSTSWTELNGTQAGTRTVSTDPANGASGFDGLGIGPKFKLNGPFDATALIYDNIGTFVGSTTVAVDTGMIIAQGLDQGTGAFEVYIDWNGKDASGNATASGVYMFRVVAYHDVINEDTGVKGRKMLMNKVTKVGVKTKP